MTIMRQLRSFAEVELQMILVILCLNTFRSQQNGCQFADEIYDDVIQHIQQLGCKTWLHNFLWRWNFRLIFMLLLGKLRPEQNGWCFPGDIFKCIFMNEKSWILNKISLDYVCKCLRDNTINQWLGLKLGHAVAQAVRGHVNAWTNDHLFHRCIHVLPFLTHCVPGRSILYLGNPQQWLSARKM